MTRYHLQCKYDFTGIARKNPRTSGASLRLLLGTTATCSVGIGDRPVAEGGSDDEENLCLACRACNNAKSTKTEGLDPLTGRSEPLFNPRKQVWQEHFRWSASGVEIIGLTPSGRATVSALDLNNVISAMVRRNWVSAGWHPPKD